MLYLISREQHDQNIGMILNIGTHISYKWCGGGEVTAIIGDVVSENASNHYIYKKKLATYFHIVVITNRVTIVIRIGHHASLMC